MHTLNIRRLRAPMLPAIVAVLGITALAPAASWMTNSPMLAARQYHTATLLPNGKVLVAGGEVQNAPTNTAELYEPATGIWTQTGSMHANRELHTATLLRNGKVLVAGGRYFDGGNPLPLASAELYEPTTGTWSLTGSLTNPGSGHTATLLADGRLMITGGYDETNNLARTEIYHPATGTWSSAQPLNAARVLHTAALLTNGTVLVTGGIGTAQFMDTTEVFDRFQPAHQYAALSHLACAGRERHTDDGGQEFRGESHRQGDREQQRFKKRPSEDLIDGQDEYDQHDHDTQQQIAEVSQTAREFRFGLTHAQAGRHRTEQSGLAGLHDDDLGLTAAHGGAGEHAILALRQCGLGRQYFRRLLYWEGFACETCFCN